MHWIVQRDLFNERGYSALLETLVRFDIPHTVVKVVPFSHELVLPDGETFPDLTGQSVYVCGSTTLAKVAQTRGWVPGSFINDNFHFSKWYENFGEYLLNHDSVVGKFGDVTPPMDSSFFIRPCEDTKTFSGQVMTGVEFHEWKHKVLALKETYTTLDADTMVSYASLKHILREYRFFVVDGKVITGSLYKMGTLVVPRSDVEDTVWDFAQVMVDVWQPARAFVIDIAETDDGYRVIEINNINSAGFYACDVSKIVQYVESMDF